MSELTREETYLAAISGEDVGELPTPRTRKENLLHKIAVNGGGGGGGEGNIDKEKIVSEVLAALSTWTGGAY